MRSRRRLDQDERPGDGEQRRNPGQRPGQLQKVLVAIRRREYPRSVAAHHGQRQRRKDGHQRGPQHVPPQSRRGRCRDQQRQGRIAGSR